MQDRQSDKIPLCILKQSQRAISAMASDAVPCDRARLMLVNAASIVCVQARARLKPSFFFEEEKPWFNPKKTMV